MSWLSIIGKIVLHIILLPVKFLISLIFNFLYFPSLKFDKNIYYNRLPVDVNKKVEEIKDSLNLDGYIDDGDGAKFIGLAYTSCKDKRLWDKLSTLLFGMTCFLRAPWEEDYDRKAFSGDMWAGMFPAILTALECNHMSEWQKKQVLTIIENTIFNGKTFVFKHPTEEKQDRGFVFPLWSMCSNFFDVISMCYIAEKLKGGVKYKVLRWIFTAVGFPLMFFLRQGIFVKSVYALNFFTEHSSLVKAYYVYKLCGYEFLKNSIIRHCNDNPWFMDSGKFLKNITGDSTLYDLHLNDYLNSDNTENIPWSFKYTYFSLKGFEKKDYSLYSLPYRFRMGTKYLDDSKPMEPKNYIQKNGKADIIHLYDW